MPDQSPDQRPRVILGNKDVAASECQCDACPPSAPLTLAHSAPPRGPHSLPPTLTTSRLDDRHWLAYAPAASAGPAVLNDPALALLRRFEHPRPFQGPASGTPAQESEQDALLALRQAHLIAPAACPTPHHSEPPEMLVAWVHTTHACNLRCTYCYLDAAPETMSAKVGARAVDAVFRSAVTHCMSGIKLKYAGGEPTLAFPLIARLHRRATELAKERALKLDGVVISNGVSISDEIFAAMQALGLRLAISLDGLGEHHDCQRRLSDGSGSFAAVSSTIDRALSLDVIPDISVTVTARNLPGLPALTHWLLERDLPFRLEFYRQHDTSTPHDDLRPGTQRTIETMRAVFKLIESNLPRRSLLASLLDRTNLAWPHARACGAGVNYLAIDPHGQIATCQMDIGRTITSIYADDPLADLRADQTGLSNPSADEKSDCWECQWRHWCGGGCPLESYRATGRWNAKSPYCAIYKALFSEVLRLEGLRLLKYGQATLQ
ncbi:MAG: radical SAM protein [Anaerolineae bacterium]|jgi:uncharacterized protein